jgi:hypothetical protein
MTNKESIPFRVYKHSKVWVNYILDRVIELCDLVLMDIYWLPWLTVQNIVQTIARYIGDQSWLLRDLPRLDAYQLTGANWTIIFVGGKQGLLEIGHLFFADENVAPQEIGRVALWHLAAQSQAWLAAGVDLVVCELSRLYPRPPQTAITFAVPTWINHSLPLPEPLESLLAGNQMRTLRNNFNRAQKSNFAWYYSRAKEDFDDFHYNMYLPYIKGRHGDRALIGAYEDQQQQWFAKGGLLVVTQNNRRVGGVLCYVKGDTCYAIEAGVLHNDSNLLEQGIKVSMDWFTMNWARQQGAQFFNFGGTRAWRSDGVFFYKSRWRAKVIRRQKIVSAWTFLAQNLSPALQNHINKLGFISEIDGKFCAVLVNPDGASPDKKELSHIAAEGLNGWLVVSPHQRQVILCPPEHNNP